MMADEGSHAAGHPDLHECHDCGLFQRMQPLRPGQVAACTRCAAVLRRRRRDSLSTILALTLACLALMLVGAVTPILTITITGQERTTSLLYLPTAFEEQGMPLLAIVMLATTLIAPVLRLVLTAWVMLGIRLGQPRRLLVTMARLRHMLAPWAMIEVFLLGFLVAYTRLETIASVQLGTGLFALAGVMLITAWSDTWLDEEAMWNGIARQGAASAEPRPKPRASGPARLIGCDVCGLASHGAEGDDCPRCQTPLRHRKPQPVARTWALIIAAAVLYIPANLYPVLTVIRLGKGAPSTIFHGVVELIEYRMWPLAALVFVASILVPVLKLVGLAFLLIMTQRRSRTRLADRTRLFRLVDIVGRWSMIDVFMVAILTALVRMGVIASVTPGAGAVAFASVVVLTMAAALSFDPRVMWDEAGVPAGAAAPRNAAGQAVPA